MKAPKEYLVVPDVPGGMWAVSGALELIILDSHRMHWPCYDSKIFNMCFCEVPREALNLNLMTTRLWRRRTQLRVRTQRTIEDLVTSCDTSCLVAEDCRGMECSESHRSHRTQRQHQE